MWKIILKDISVSYRKSAIKDSSRAAYLSLIALDILYFLFLLLLGVDRHWSFKTSVYDTGGFDQVIWNALYHGAATNTINLSLPINWLGFHFHPILYFFVPLYKIIAAPEWLIITQAFAISACALPIYKTAIELDYFPWQAFLWSLGYLLNPFVLSAALWDFHPVAVATPLIALSICFLLKQEYKKLSVCVLVLLLCQEQFGLVSFCLGVSYYLIHKNFKISFFFLAIGTVYTIILFLYIFPLFSPTGTHMMMSREIPYLNRYGWLGNSFSEISHHIISSPLNVIKTAVKDLDLVSYLLLLLIPFGLALPLLGFDILLIGMVDFAANTLSLIPLQKSMYGYHSITLIPIIIIASMIGYRRLCKIVSPRSGRGTVILLISAFLLLVLNSFPSIFGKNSLWMLSIFPEKDHEIENIKNRIPHNAVLSVQANIGSHFSQRKFIYAYPARATESDYIVLRMQDPNGIIADTTFRFIHHMRMSQKDYLSSIKCLLMNHNFQIDYFNFPWLVLKKHPQESRFPELSIVDSYLDTLAKHWKIENLTINQCPWIK